MSKDEKGTSSLKEADLILLAGTNEIEPYLKRFGDKKFIAAIEIHPPDDGVRAPQPENVFVMDGRNLMTGEHCAAAMFKHFRSWRDSCASIPT